MGRFVFKEMVFLLSFLSVFLIPAAPGICAGQEKTDPGTAKKREETIKAQEAKIKELQAEVNQLRDSGTKDSEQQQQQSNQYAVEQALRDSWTGSGAESRIVKITDGVISITFNDLHDIINFFESGAEGHARSDLAVFLKQTGLERGTIEYSSAEKRLYAISGSLAEAKTTQYY